MLKGKHQAKLKKIFEADNQRQRFIVSNGQPNQVVIDGKPSLNFTSNDYLGINHEQMLKQALIDAIAKYGMGSGASALISGYQEPHYLLEQKMANFLGRDQAILFSSGFLANVGLMTTFADRETTIFADRDCHASIIHGIQLSRAKFKRYQHGDYDQVESFLQSCKTPTLTVTEGVFSMDGSMVDVRRLATITKQYQSLLVVDDAHGVGVLGAKGKGTCEVHHLHQQDAALLVVPLGKAFAGLGAVVAGDAENIEMLLQCAGAYRYTTALPPHLAVGMLTVLAIIEEQSWRREKLHNNILLFLELVKEYRLPLINAAQTPIKSFLIGDSRRTLQLQKDLLSKGFFVSCIRPATVPQGSARLRVSLNCLHQAQDIQQLLLALRDSLCV